ncbi:J domain-containing protein [Butyrivibrio sp.]|uniref:J domain-containing protein n=1 Tax=Butyrivibrio sp. TaxID=28121 RepID=UPI0025BD8403|nr:J domain-containing protein [Butyrivibrio sp.]MBE5836412.1 J domain-containing protein [Butyrivibrio sp.]
MVSFLMMAVNAISSIVVSVLKAFFSMLSWFIRAYVRFLKLFFCILPVTSISFFLLLCINVFLLFGGNFGLLSIGAGPDPQVQAPHSLDIQGSDLNIPEEMVKEANNSFTKNNYVVTSFYNDIRTWWIESVYSYKGAPLYIFLLILTIIMIIPVGTILLSISVFMSFSKIIFFCIIADAVIYVLRAFIGKGFVSQALDRYYHLFPDAGKRHYEKDYEKWLKNRSYADSEDEHDHRRSKRASFYEDEDDDYEDEDYEYEDYDEEDYDDEDYDDEDYDDEDYDEDYDEEYDDEYDKDEAYEDDDVDYDDEPEDDYDDIDNDEYDYNNSGNGKRYNNSKYNKNTYGSATQATSSSFDFFAGCTTKESVDKKYKSLVKLYHPDNMDGDTAALQEINVQYDKAKRKFS